MLFFPPSISTPISAATPQQLQSVTLCFYLSPQGAVNSPATLRLGSACSEDGTEGLWKSPASAAEEKSQQGPE